MTFVGVQEAANRLGVSPRRVRQMIADRRLPAQRIGRAWAIDEVALDRTASRPAHRPWKPASAWAVLAAADGQVPQGIPAHEKHRARKRLGHGLLAVADRLCERADRRSFYAHPADIARILALPGVVRTGPSAAADHDMDLVGGGTDEAYVSDFLLERVSTSYHIEERSERPNLILRVISDADWPFPDSAEVVPRTVAAIDLLESDDQRAQRAATEILERR